MKRWLPFGLALWSVGLLRGEETRGFHFEYDIAPHLARAGCAAADCHGGATGRGGFKLSLFATNARADYEAITQELDGRRVNYADSARSLLLRKPTRQMRHKGGRIIAPESAAYRALESWIREGAPFARGEAATLVGLGLERRGERVAVHAEFENGDGVRSRRDVTALARFESTDERVAGIDEEGVLTINGPGEGWVLAHYGSLSARLPVRRPFGVPGDPRDADHVLDNAWFECLSRLGLRPAPPVDDHRLLRRLYLDLCGRPPSLREIRAFRALERPDRVRVTVERLLESDEFAEQLARSLGAWFELPVPDEDLRHTRDRNARLRAITRSFAGRDESLLDFITSLFESPARREFVHRFGDPRDRAEFTGRAFLGISIGCARCHNHPGDRWTQAQHLKFSAYFTDPRPVAGAGGAMAPGRFFLPGDGMAVEPALLPLRRVPTPEPEADRQSELVRFLREDAASAISRNAANRLFGLLVGRHLVEAPDDHRTGNPARHEPIMEVLAAEFAKEDFRLRPLVRLIATSQVYASTAEPAEADPLGADPERRYLARREARPLSGAQYLRAAAFVLGVEAPSGPVPATPLAQQLHLLNSGLLQRWLRTPGNQVDAVFDFETDPARQLEDLFLLVLTRPPHPAERAEFLPLLARADDPREVGRDLAFALLAGREFSSIR